MSDTHKRKPHKRNIASYSSWNTLKILFFFVLTFLYVPLLLLIVYGFNDSRRNVVWRGFTLKYYVAVFSDNELLWAFANSLLIALLTTAISLILGTLIGYAFWRFRFRGRALFNSLLVMPIIIPEICMGVAMLVFFSHVPFVYDLPWPLSLFPIVVAHVVFCFPFVAVVVSSSVTNDMFQFIDAARDLGAGDRKVFWSIFVPLLKSAIVAGGLLAFSLSLDDFLITFLVSGADTATLPVKIYSMVRFSVTPEVNAASTILILITIVAVFIAIRISRYEEKI